jgi:hypothetical protein
MDFIMKTLLRPMTDVKVEQEGIDEQFAFVMINITLRLKVRRKENQSVDFRQSNRIDWAELQNYLPRSREHILVVDKDHVACSVFTQQGCEPDCGHAWQILVQDACSHISDKARPGCRVDFVTS